MFIVIEIQKSDTLAVLSDTYETRNQAEQKYHTVLSFAAVSNVPKHGAVMLTEEGEYIKHECFEHEA